MVKNSRSAFTLAEMMIVMLILTILLAAFAPLMTKKSKVDLSNPWRWANNNSDIYYGMGNNQTAMIGQNNKAAGDMTSKLLINIGGNANRSHILFKSNDTTLGNLIYNTNNLLLGGPYTNNFAGYFNTVFGRNALTACTGNNCLTNSAFGHEALQAATNSRNNTAIGFQALLRHTTTDQEENMGNNVAVGSYSLHGIDGVADTGYNNTAIGSESGRRITTGHDNTAIGFASGGAGQWDGEVANTGSNNTSLGAHSLRANTTGSNNIAIGTSALEQTTSNSSNIAIGYEAGSKVATSNNILIGTAAGRELSDNIGHSIAIGNHALESATTSGSAGMTYSNIAIGVSALQNVEGYENIAIGDNTLVAHNRGHNNVALGHNSLPVLNSNINDASYNIAIGTNSGMRLTSGWQNIMIDGGQQMTSGKNNIAIGSIGPYAGTGDYNIMLGQYACSNIVGSKNVCIGFRAGPEFSGSAHSNTVWLGSTSSTLYFSGSKYTPSDKRLKNIKSKFNSGLDVIRGLTTYNFTYKKDETKQIRVGIIAQDLQKVLPSAVEKDSKGYLSVKQEQITYSMLNAIKELDKMVQDLVAQVKTIAAQIKEHDAQIKALQKENKELKAKIQTLEKQNESFNDRLKAIEKKL